MATATFYPQFEAHLADNKTLSLYDVQRMLDSDDLAEVKQLFTEYAYSKNKNAARHFLVTSYSDCSSKVVTEDALQEMRAGNMVDDACLIYIVKESDEPFKAPLHAAFDAEPFSDQIEFAHAPEVFHQNQLTKKIKQQPKTVSKAPASSASTLNLGGSKSASVQPQNTMIKKTIPSANSKPAKQTSGSLFNSWQKAPKQPQGNLGMGFTAENDGDVAMKEEEHKKPAAASKVIKKSKKDEQVADDDEEIPAATAQQKLTAGLSDEDMEVMPVRRRANKKRRVQRDSSVEEDEAMVTDNNNTTPQRVLQPLADQNTTASGGKQNLRLSEEPTAVTPSKPPQDAAPGKKWVKVKKTEQTMDAKGYMCFQDVEAWEEVDDIKPARKTAAAKASAPAAQSTAGKKQAPKTQPAQKNAKVQSALGSFFSAK